MTNSLCFVGSTSLFSLTALQTLIEQKVNISQIILAAYAPATTSDRGLPVSLWPPTRPLETDTNSITALATQHHIPIHYAGNNINDFPSWKNFPHDTPPEYLFVACFPFRLPNTLRQWPSKIAVNLHPSLLPGFRGPDPIFWQLQHGESQTGFSLHMLADALDAGPILLQHPVYFPRGASRNELDTLLAQQGSRAFCSLLSTPAPTPGEQDPHLASYHPLPQAEDFTLHAHWSAERAYNFIRGTRTPVDGYPVRLNGQQHHVISALSFESEATFGTHGKAFSRSDKDILIQFTPGVLHAKPV